MEVFQAQRKWSYLNSQSNDPFSQGKQSIQKLEHIKLNVFPCWETCTLIPPGGFTLGKKMRTSSTCWTAVLKRFIHTHKFLLARLEIWYRLFLHLHCSFSMIAFDDAVLNRELILSLIFGILVTEKIGVRRTLKLKL